MATRTVTGNLELLVIVSNPDSFVTWESAHRRDYLQRAIAWHDYIAKLKKQGKVTQAWGTQRLISNTRPSVNKSLLVAIYNLESIDEFSALVASDPLYPDGAYFTQPLEPLTNDLEQDRARYNNHKGLLQRRGVAVPNAVLDYPFETPWIRKKSTPGQIEILVLATNPPGHLEFSDQQRLDVYEKVLQWHDYNGRLMDAGIITHTWGSHQFCDNISYQSRSASAAQLFRVASFEEFDNIFVNDPLRNVTMFWTIWLLPIDESRTRCRAELKQLQKTK